MDVLTFSKKIAEHDAQPGGVAAPCRLGRPENTLKPQGIVKSLDKNFPWRHLMERRSFPFLILSLLVFSGCRGNKGESDAASFRDGPARVLDAWATESPPPSPESGWQKANPGDRDREGDYVGKVLIAAFDGNFANKVKLRLACAMNLDAEIIEAIFRSGQRAAPEYWHLYHQYAYFLLPRWYGSRHSEWSEWLATALADSSLPKIDQDRIYAQVVLRQLSFAYNDPHEPRVNVTGVDWERVREGTSRLMADFPLSTRIPNALLRGAVAHADFEGIEQALRWMNGYYDAGHWSGQNDLEFFNLVDRLKTIAPHLAEALRLD